MATAIVASSNLASGDARAADPPVMYEIPGPEYPPPATEPPRRIWYGWETLLVDATSITLLIAGATASSNEGRVAVPLMVMGIAGFVVGGPSVHLANGKPGKAVGDLAMRTIGPAFVGGLFSLVGHSDSGFDFSAVYGVFGASLAGCAAIAIDAAALARKPAPTPPAMSWTIVPRLQPGRGSAGLTLGGTF